MVSVCLLYTLLLPVRCWYACLAYFASPIWLFLLLCTLAYMFMHKSVCCPYSNPMELWTLDPKLHLSSWDTPLLFDNMFVCPCLASFPNLSLACFSFICFFACLLFCLCMYTQGARILGARVRLPRCKQKGQGWKQKDASPQRAMIRRLWGLASLKWFSLSLSLSLFSRAYIRVPIHESPFTFLHLAWANSMGMAMFVLHFLYLARPYPWNVGNVWFTFPLCVITLCMMYVYLYLLVYGWLCTFYDGLLWLREHSLVVRALDLVVWVCA